MSDFEKTARLIGDYLSGLDPTVVYGIMGGGVLLFLVALLVAASRRKTVPDPVLQALDEAAPLGPAPPQPPPPVPPPHAPTLRDRMIAEMTETSSLNGFGGFCVALMILNWIIAALVFLAAASAPQQAVAALIWIGGNTFFGLAALLNRERKYRVYKPLQ
ncbi:hypothetical protein [Bradyrhizobium sp.]|uniref:hypothetical protein n=1 Tax=Bradyrhizobium sp. TaxID=376 RepID=UPI0039E235DF